MSDLFVGGDYIVVMRYLFLSLLLACGSSKESATTPPGPDSGDSATEDTTAPTETGAVTIAPVVQFDGARPTHLLVISVDTLRWDRVSEPGVMPFLRRVLDRGVVAAQHQSCANWTHPSMTCAWSGRNIWEYGLLPVGASDARLDEDVVTLPTMLADHGYSSVLVAANGFVAEEKFGLGDAFDVVHLDREGGIDSFAEIILETAEGFAGPDPLYLHVHFMEPHSPYDFQEGFTVGPADLPEQMIIEDYVTGWRGMTAERQAVLVEQLSALYDGEVRYLDTRLAQLWHVLDQRGLLDDTLVVFLTDHGEQFSEHGALAHGRSVHREETDAMFALWSKGIQPVSFQRHTGHRDVVPTVLDALGLPPVEVDGHVLGMAPADVLTFSAFAKGQDTELALDYGNERLIYIFNGNASYYVDDPLELNDLGPGHPELVRDLFDLMRPEVAKLEEVLGITAVEP